MEFNKEEITALRSILLPDSGHTDFIALGFVRDFFADYLKEVLFVTDDNVEVLEGDSYFYITQGDALKVLKCSHAVKGFQPHISFSTESAAKEFINNYKQYSMNDMLKAVNNWSAISHITEYEIKDFLEK